MKPHKNKQGPDHPWILAGIAAKKARIKKIAAAIAALRAARG